MYKKDEVLNDAKMITNTDEELQQKWLDCSYTKGGVPEMLRAFLTYYIAKDRARGEVVVTLDHEIPSKITVGDYVLWEAPAYEPQSYWEICYAACWGGRFKSEYDALEDDGREGMRSIREVKPTDEHYKPAWRSKPELTFIRYSLAEINKETKP